MVSYLIVAFRSRQTLEKLLTSINGQSGKFDTEIIIVDNSPQENCAKIAKDFPSVTYILNRSNLGYTHAMNQAIAASHGDCLFLLNPDVELLDDCTNTLVTRLQNSESAVAAAPQLLNLDGTIQPSVRNFPTFATLLYDHLVSAKYFPRSRTLGRWRNLYFNHDTSSEVEQPMASALMIKREVVNKIGKLDEQFFVFFSDVDFCKRIRKSGAKILFEPTAKAHHVLGGSTRQEGTWLIRDSHHGFYRYLAKHELIGIKAALKPIAATMLFVSALFRIIFRNLSGRSF